MAPGSGEGERKEQTLAFQRAARDSGEQVFVEDAFVERVLIDDDQAIVAFDNEVAVVKLDGGDDGGRGLERGGIGGHARRGG